jgi:hypothetical protein
VDHIEIGEKLGSGAYKDVYEATNGSNNFALALSRGTSLEHDWRREKEKAKKLKEMGFKVNTIRQYGTAAFEGEEKAFAVLKPYSDREYEVLDKKNTHHARHRGFQRYRKPEDAEDIFEAAVEETAELVDREIKLPADSVNLRREPGAELGLFLNDLAEAELDPRSYDNSDWAKRYAGHVARAGISTAETGTLPGDSSVLSRHETQEIEDVLYRGIVQQADAEIS